MQLRKDPTKTERPRTRGLFDVSTFDEKNKTVQITLTTEQPVKMWNWEIGWFNEILQCDKASIKADRLNNGLPVLNNHNRWDSVAENTLGIVESWDVINGKLVGTVRFSDRQEIQSFVQDVQKGIIRSVSVGYRVNKYQIDSPGSDTELATYRAVEWEPMEVSFVQVAADSQATTRGSEENEPNDFIIVDKTNNVVKVKSINNNPKKEVMTPEEREALLKAEKERCLAINAAVRAAGLENAMAEKLERKFIEENKTIEEVRLALDELKRSANEGAQAASESAKKAVLDGNKEIIEAVKAAKLPDSFALNLIQEGKTIEEARKAIIDEFTKEDPNSGTKGANVTVGADEETTLRQRMEDAFHIRANADLLGNGLTAERKEGAREFRVMSFVDMARHYLNFRGVNTAGWSKREIAQRALTGSDFPYILQNALNKTLRKAYDIAPKTFLPFVKRVDANDFKEMSVAQLSGLYRGFEKINPGGEYKASKMTDDREKYGIKKYGEMIKITWEDIINDDLGAFSRVAPAFGENSAHLQSDIVYGILLDGTTITLNDNIAIFDASTHKNYISSGTDISDININTLRTLVREQKSPDGKYLNIEPAYLVCGPKKEMKANQYTSVNYVANEQGKTVPKFITSLQPIIDARITGNTWFLISNPGRIDTIQISHLAGEEEVYTESKWGFETDCFLMKARTEFGAAAIDYRGMARNNGA